MNYKLKNRFKRNQQLKILRQLCQKNTKDQKIMNKTYKFDEFEILENLGSTHQGFTKLYVIRQNRETICVCKAISKCSLKDGKSVQHIKNQKQALLHFTKINTQGVNRIINTFQDQENLYILIDLVEGLPLHKLLQMTGPFNEDFTRLIVTQVGLIMKSFHTEGYIYRDIKASNFMINSKGKITMIDLGKAKNIGKEKTFTICGTTHSMPPQIYDGKGYSYEFDYYSFGVLIYQLLTGSAPFGYDNFSEDYLKKIKAGLSEDHLSKINCPITRDLILKLMKVNSVERLGANNGFDQILEHDYFNCPQFCDYKDVLEETYKIDRKDQRFELYLSQIEDFGLQICKYDEIKADDPFYKFFG